MKKGIKIIDHIGNISIALSLVMLLTVSVFVYTVDDLLRFNKWTYFITLVLSCVALSLFIVSFFIKLFKKEFAESNWFKRSIAKTFAGVGALMVSLFFIIGYSSTTGFKDPHTSALLFGLISAACFILAICLIWKRPKSHDSK